MLHVNSLTSPLCAEDAVFKQFEDLYGNNEPELFDNRDMLHNRILREHIQRNVYNYEPIEDNPLYFDMLDDVMLTSLVQSATYLQGVTITNRQHHILEQKLDDFKAHNGLDRLSKNPYARIYESMADQYNTPADELQSLDLKGIPFPKEHCFHLEYDQVAILHETINGMDSIDRIMSACTAIYNGVEPNDYAAGQAVKNGITDQFKQGSVKLPTIPVNDDIIFKQLTMNGLAKAVSDLDDDGDGELLSAVDMKVLNSYLDEKNINIDNLYRRIEDSNHGVPIDYSLDYKSFEVNGFGFYDSHVDSFLDEGFHTMVNALDTPDNAGFFDDGIQEREFVGDESVVLTRDVRSTGLTYYEAIDRGLFTRRKQNDLDAQESVVDENVVVDVESDPQPTHSEPIQVEIDTHVVDDGPEL